MDSEIVDKSGKHSASFQVDDHLFRFIKGKWGLTQKQVEEETGVKIIFPISGGDSIVIEGSSSQDVSRAYDKLSNIIEQAVKSPNFDYSHFVSLPLAFNPDLVKKLHTFQNSVLEDCSSDGSSDELQQKKDCASSELGIDRSIFINPQTFHLTVIMLKLWNKDRVTRASEVLKEISSKVYEALENHPVSIRLKGLECMRGSPAKAGVVYAPIEDLSGNNHLSRACQVIIDAYVEAGLVLEKDAMHSLKLHATMMNARYGKRNMRTKKHDFANFDARRIFKKFGSEDWGEYIISEAHLSQRFKYDESGYFHCCGSIPFPQITKFE